MPDGEAAENDLVDLHITAPQSDYQAVLFPLQPEDAYAIQVHGPAAF